MLGPVGVQALKNMGTLCQETHDFEEQAALLRGWNQDYAQISSGAFSGYVSDMRFEDVHLFLEYTSQSLYQSGRLDDDTVAIGIPLTAQHQGMFCGSVSTAESMHVFSGDDGFEFFSPGELVMGGISVSRSALLNSLAPQEQQWLMQHDGQAHVQSLDPAKVQAVREFMSGVFHLVGQTPEILENRQITASMRSTVLGLLADCLIDSQQLQSEHLSPSKCWHIVSESRALVHSRSENPVSVAELCQHLGVSRRTLQYSFQNLLNTSPVAYLRSQRLNGTRRMLKQGVSVTDAATAWGFWHFGHFSQEYKKLFGELPSDTLRRQGEIAAKKH
ncbi:AraC family transcriptional regulator, ethanolamine operon transcriptional activator [Novimethylophilus kurashikiensis]|uniref:AraC family transcriptional regulator, ethanolamine operon transcriptional activator n=1 Tax=Novimethylophilus kurashikiensis TaxID=1825523 RepID=A0A2R5F790_9PROT|nr:helix-turn-helix domain-containing protein [Novimethylophilus kurashikiensis]GBG12551.1 AraC family transcriptional regulator, ethanolamine operon transcriptional activator [Novimethylophilus kurashikiensis]